MNNNPWKSRWSDAQIRALLIEQFEVFWQKNTGIEREKLSDVKRASSLPHAVIVTGLRRVGKSTLLAQFAHTLGDDHFFYINFEDDRFLNFQADDFNDLYQVLVEIFGERKTFILDEVQNIQGWEFIVRRFTEQGFKFYLSGSNASLLSRELGTRLTGRYITIELFPFSFSETLRFYQLPLPDFKRMNTVDQANLNRAFTTYLESGGIPDALKYPELPLLRTLYDDVLFRDIAARYRLEAVTALKELAYFLVSNPSGMVSFNKIKERLRLGSVNTVISYVEYLENSWLIFTSTLYDFSVKRQQVAPKKIYCIDTGMINSVGFHFSQNTGKLIENLIFLALRRNTRDIYYYLTSVGYEIDFYLPKERQLIQVCQRIDQESTRQREYRAIGIAAKELEVTNALILCDHDEKDELVNGVNISVKAIPQWLLEQKV